MRSNPPHAPVPSPVAAHASPNLHGNLPKTLSYAIGATVIQAALFATPAFGQETTATEARNVAILILPAQTPVVDLGYTLVDTGVVSSELDLALLDHGVIMGELNPSLYEGGVIMGELNPWLIDSGLIKGEYNPLLEGGVIMGELNPALASGVIMGEYNPEGTALWLDTDLIDDGVIIGESTPAGGVIMGEFDPDLLAGGVIVGEYDPDISSGVIMGELNPEGIHGGVIMGEFNPPIEFGVGGSPPGINLLALSSEQVRGVIIGEFDPETGSVINLRVELDIRRRFLLPAIEE
jgi:hypothetical protein